MAIVEINVLKEPIGKQDQYASAFGGVNYIRFNDDENSTIMPLSTKYNLVVDIFSNMLTFWTGIERQSEMVLDEQDKKNNLIQVPVLVVRCFGTGKPVDEYDSHLVF